MPILITAGTVLLSLPFAQSAPAPPGADWVQLVPAASMPNHDDCDRPIVTQTVASLNGNYIYQLICRWETSDDVVQVRRRDGRRREVTPGNSLAVVRNGPWRGYLLVEKHIYRFGALRGAYDATWIVRPDGKKMFKVPGTDDDDPEVVQAWLRKHRWIAN